MTVVLRAPMAATVVEIAVRAGQAVHAGEVVAVLEAMKMEHELCAPCDGIVDAVGAVVGEALSEGDVVLEIRPAAAGAPPASVSEPSVPLAAAPLRADLARALERHALTADAARRDAVARRHAAGLRTARENVADLCDDGSFVEYGALAVAAQASRRSADDLMRNTPADGIVTGIGAVGGVRCAVLAYDATVLAGTQGLRGHQKTDRLLAIAFAERLPVVLFAEGGGGRPGDVDAAVVAGLHVPTFAAFARLSGRVPLVGIVAGRCFAGNAALLGCCDQIVAVQGCNIGMGGPAMVEGGGLGAFRPEEIGPGALQARNGVIDLLVASEAEAVAVTKALLSLLRGTGPVAPPESIADEPALRAVLPEQRGRSYDMRAVLARLADADSLVELRPAFGVGIHTALARIGGRPVALLANNPLHLGGAIDADAADKAARFLQLADAHALPVVSLVDTPGFMVGPEIEARAQVRHVSRMFVVGAQRRVPFVALVLRKGYGLGAMAMTGGGFHAALATAAWPGGEFGGMGLEGAVRLGYRKELAAAADEAARDALFQRLLGEKIEAGSALNMAAALEIDAVIDPASSRRWIAQVLAAARTGEAPARYIDPW